MDLTHVVKLSTTTPYVLAPSDIPVIRSSDAYLLVRLFYPICYSLLTPETVTEPVEIDHCIPSPCGLNSQCRIVGSQAACSCLPNNIGRPPNCRPECKINPECPQNLMCINDKCMDPCPGSCGSSTTCMVLKHTPVCQCVAGYTGDPFTGCISVPTSKKI